MRDHLVNFLAGFISGLIGFVGGYLSALDKLPF